MVEAADADDVAALVRHAHQSGLTVTAQAGGHGATGDLAGVILLRTARLDELHIEPHSRTARVGAGVAWGRVQAEAGRHGLTGLPGSSPVVSVTGYTLGGGLSWFSRRHGWAADSVTAFDVVDAEGIPARVTASSDADLFWALRGSGGDFALVTGMEFDLHPAPALYGGRMLWPVERAPWVFDAFHEITADPAGELTVWANLLNLPGSSPIVAIDTAFLGEAREGSSLLRSLERIGDLISDSRGPLPVAELGSITAEPTDPGPSVSRGELLNGLGDVGVKALLAEFSAPLLSVQIRHLGGALARPSHSPHGAVHEPYALYQFGVAPTPRVADGIRRKQRKLSGALGPLVSGRKPYTYLAAGEKASDAFVPETLARLRLLKHERDAHGVFRSNFPVLA